MQRMKGQQQTKSFLESRLKSRNREPVPDITLFRIASVGFLHADALPSVDTCAERDFSVASVASVVPCS